MPLINLSVRHGRSRDDARARLEAAVNDVRVKFGPMVQTVDWSDDRDAVTVRGAGFVVEMKVDAEQVHVTGDIPILGALLGKPLETGLKQIIQQKFSKT